MIIFPFGTDIKWHTLRVHNEQLLYPVIFLNMKSPYPALSPFQIIQSSTGAMEWTSEESWLYSRQGQN
jgi:hypothetical protein